MAQSGCDGGKATSNASQVYEIDIDMWHTAYIFPKGHRIRVAISSAAYPYYDANPNTGSLESASIPPSKFEPVAAKNTLHMAPNSPSKLTLPVVRMQDIPKNPHFGAFPLPESTLDQPLIV